MSVGAAAVPTPVTFHVRRLLQRTLNRANRWPCVAFAARFQRGKTPIGTWHRDPQPRSVQKECITRLNMRRKTRKGSTTLYSAQHALAAHAETVVLSTSHG